MRHTLREILSATWLAVLLGTAPATAISAEPPIRIGLVGPFAPWVWVNTLGPTLEYLRNSFPDREVKTVEVTEVKPDSPFDYFVSQSGTYWVANRELGAVHMATRLSRVSPDPALSDGVAVVVPTERTDLRSIDDLKGESVAITDRRAFQGWGILSGLLAQRGHDPEKFFSEVHETHYQELGVPWEIATGRATAGVMQLCMFEELEQTGELTPGSFRVLPYAGVVPEQKSKCQHTTELYPDMVFSALPSADAESVREMTAKLLTMPTLPEGYAWGSARDFSALDRMYRALKLGPYEYLRTTTLQGFVRLYKAWIIAALIALAALILHSVRTGMLVRRRTASLQKVLSERDALAREADSARARLSGLERSGMVSQLSSMVAHELKQPAGAIVNYSAGLEILASRGNIPKPLLVDVIGKIHRQAIEIARIVDHVRSYAKSRGAEHVSCDLAAILRRCARTTSLASSSGINVALSVRKEPALIEGDPLELELALHNLLKNALEAASEHPSPFVRALLDEAPGGWKVVIENSGAEVPEAVVREMGHAFLGTTKGQKGLGLGLPIALEIVERHGGRTSFEARPGGGLRADVFLPSSKSVIVSAGRRNPGEKTNSGETHV